MRLVRTFSFDGTCFVNISGQGADVLVYHSYSITLLSGEGWKEL